MSHMPKKKKKQENKKKERERERERERENLHHRLRDQFIYKQPSRIIN